MNRVMKDSGIPWIGEIPKEWETMRFKNFVSLKTTSSASDNKIGLENIESESGRFVETESKFEGNGVGFEKGDIVYGKLRPYLRKVWLATFNGNAVGDFFVFSSKNNSDCHYIKWLLLSDGFTKEVIGSTYGAKMPRVSSEFILMLPYTLPPLQEQRRIADFLDRKCGEIDEMIALQEEFIEELKAYKQSVISETVTRGLNPNVKFKDSGIDWIGEIPQGWGVCRIKDIFILRTGTTPKGFEQGNDTDAFVNWFTPSDVSEMNCEISCSERHLSKELIAKEGIELNPVGSLIFVGIGASAGKVGYALVEGYSNQQITMLIPKGNKCVSKYSYYYMIADRKRIRDNAFFTTLPIINNSYLSGIRTLFPPIPEQKQIADYLDNKCTEIDSLIAIKQQKIEELKDYKKSVIYEYVTGKKEVNG